MWREPLVHFLAVGGLLFAGYGLLTGGRSAGDLRQIDVDRDGLVFFVQQRYGRLGTDAAGAWLDEQSRDALQRLIDDYVLEEALYREAKALRLDQDDYAERRRLITQLEYLHQASIGDAVALTDEQIARFYEENVDRYFAEATITFAHVFVSDDRDDGADALELARVQLTLLNERGVAFNDTGGMGDRFLYHRYYAGRGYGEVASHFGRTMADALRELSPDENRWQGPLRSDYGYHLVMIAQKTPGRTLPLADVVDRVTADATSAHIRQELDRIHGSILQAYRVELASDLGGRVTVP